VTRKIFLPGRSEIGRLDMEPHFVKPILNYILQIQIVDLVAVAQEHLNIRKL